jgi:hypothetical protein
MPSHPGNIFMAGDWVQIRVPRDSAGVWHVLDYDHHEVATVAQREGLADLGRLAPGYYRLIQEGTNWISCAVLEPLKAATPLSSPIALDVAMT